jgi:hypothetical protein
MPVPENFNEFEHLQNVLMKTHNRIVTSFFRNDLLDDDITSPEGAVKYAVTIKDNDNGITMLTRMLLFLGHCGYLENMFNDSFYGIPISEFHETTAFLPQVTLVFRETKKDSKRLGRANAPKRFRISFRIQKQSNLITNSDIIQLRNLINLKFPPTGKHYCGLNLYDYYDPINGVNKHYFLPARSKAEAVKFYYRFFDLLDILVDQSFITEKKMAIRKQKTVSLLGEPTQIKQSPVVGTVRLKSVWLHIWGKKSQEKILERDIDKF